VFFVAPLEAVRNSVMVAAGTVALSLPLALATAHLLARARRPFFAEAVVAAPLGTSAVTLGVGYLLGFAVAPLAWRTSPVILPVVHSVIALPLAVRVMVPAAVAVSGRLHDAAAVLGATPARVWRTVDLPLLSRALAVAGAIVAAVSLGEFGAALFLARPDFPTVPVLVYRALGQPGALNLARAFALSSLLAGLCVGAAVVADRVRGSVLRAPI
jgi:thiamine transport system permease protein